MIREWISRYFSTSKAKKLSDRGLARARKRDYLGAIEDYTAALFMTVLPEDLRIQTCFNLALAHVAAGHNQQGIDELNVIIGQAETPMNIRTLARQKLVRMKFRSREKE